MCLQLWNWSDKMSSFINRPKSNIIYTHITIQCKPSLFKLLLYWIIIILDNLQTYIWYIWSISCWIYFQIVINMSGRPLPRDALRTSGDPAAKWRELLTIWRKSISSFFIRVLALLYCHHRRRFVTSAAIFSMLNCVDRLLISQKGVFYGKIPTVTAKHDERSFYGVYLH